ETVPSEVMLEVWSASSPAERAKAQQDIRELLDRGVSVFKERWTDPKTISYLGGYGLPFLEALFQDSDAHVRASALYATADSIMATIWFNHMIDSEGPVGNKRPWA